MLAIAALSEGVALTNREQARSHTSSNRSEFLRRYLGAKRWNHLFGESRLRGIGLVAEMIRAWPDDEESINAERAKFCEFLNAVARRADDREARDEFDG